MPRKLKDSAHATRRTLPYDTRQSQRLAQSRVWLYAWLSDWLVGKLGIGKSVDWVSEHDSSNL